MAITTTYKVLFWKDIPSMIEAEDTTGDVIMESMGERFEVLIDAKAMALGIKGGDAYTDAFLYGDESELPGDAESVVGQLKQKFESEFN
jgi:hypothetical protein